MCCAIQVQHTTFTGGIEMSVLKIRIETEEYIYEEYLEA